jgi:hypothetical protein
MRWCQEIVMIRFVSAGFFTVCFSTITHASPIQTVHQSRLIDVYGEPLQGSHAVRIAMWDSAAGGQEQWGETFNVDGVLLGERTALTTVPYAVHATSVAQGVPVGTILPFAGDALSLDDSWMVCDGGTVSSPGAGLVDFNSSAGGIQVPNLTDNRFLMGVSASSVAASGGRNDIPAGGAHTHTFGQTASDLAPDASNVSNGSFTNPAGSHNHGGENRPLFTGVQYIIRVR